MVQIQSMLWAYARVVINAYNEKETMTTKLIGRAASKI